LLARGRFDGYFLFKTTRFAYLEVQAIPSIFPDEANRVPTSISKTKPSSLYAEFGILTRRRGVAEKEKQEFLIPPRLRVSASPRELFGTITSFPNEAKLERDPTEKNEPNGPNRLGRAWLMAP
jgi:hypothetical protein